MLSDVLYGIIFYLSIEYAEIQLNKDRPAEIGQCPRQRADGKSMVLGKCSDRSFIGMGRQIAEKADPLLGQRKGGTADEAVVIPIQPYMPRIDQQHIYPVRCQRMGETAVGGDGGVFAEL